MKRFDYHEENLGLLGIDGDTATLKDTQTTKSRTFQNIQALRAVAALLVVVGHIHLNLGFDFIIVNIPLWYSGVDIFFVISGFIICTVALRIEPASGKERIRQSVKFTSRRLIRIFPIYWIVLAASIFASIWFNIKPEWMPEASIVYYIFLLTKFNAYVPQAWTLCYELFFYLALAAIILISPQRLFRYIFIWMLLQLVIFGYATARNVAEPRILSDALILEFGFGCLVAFLIHHGVRAHALTALVIGLVFFAAGTIWTYHHNLLDGWGRTITFGIGAGFIVYAATTSELSRSFISSRPLQILGDASYSMYLWHYMIVVILGNISFESGLVDMIPRQFIFIGTILVVIAVGLASYRWIELPINKRLNMMMKKFDK